MKRTLVAVSQDQVESLAGNCYEVHSELKKLQNYLQTIHVMCILKKMCGKKLVSRGVSSSR